MLRHDLVDRLGAAVAINQDEAAGAGGHGGRHKEQGAVAGGRESRPAEAVEAECVAGDSPQDGARRQRHGGAVHSGVRGRAQGNRDVGRSVGGRRVGIIQVLQQVRVDPGREDLAAARDGDGVRRDQEAAAVGQQQRATASGLHVHHRDARIAALASDGEQEVVVVETLGPAVGRLARPGVDGRDRCRRSPVRGHGEQAGAAGTAEDDGAVVTPVASRRYAGEFRHQRRRRQRLIRFGRNRRPLQLRSGKETDGGTIRRKERLLRAGGVRQFHRLEAGDRPNEQPCAAVADGGEGQLPPVGGDGDVKQLQLVRHQDGQRAPDRRRRRWIVIRQPPAEAGGEYGDPGEARDQQRPAGPPRIRRPVRVRTLLFHPAPWYATDLLGQTAAWYDACPLVPASRITILTGPAAGARLDAAADYLRRELQDSPAPEVLLVGQTHAAADELARGLAMEAGALFGLHRFGLRQLAWRVAQMELARRGLAPASPLAAEAVATHAAFEELAGRRLNYLHPIAKFRTFGRTLAATLRDLRHAGVDPDAAKATGGSGPDVARLAGRYDALMAAAGLVDDAALFRVAAGVAEGEDATTTGLPLGGALVLLDVAVPDRATYDLISAIVRRAASVLVTVPTGDDRTLSALRRLPGAETVDVPDAAREDGSGAAARDPLDRVRRYLFAAGDPPAADDDSPDTDTLTFFSAPGESREAMEIARAIVKEAARGVRFDEMAIVIRSPGGLRRPGRDGARPRRRRRLLLPRDTRPASRRPRIPCAAHLRPREPVGPPFFGVSLPGPGPAAGFRRRAGGRRRALDAARQRAGDGAANGAAALD